MTRAWMIGLWLLTTLPLVALLLHVRLALANRWRKERWVARILFLALALSGSAFLLSRPHENLFTGLDDAAYHHMATAFSDGRGLHETDTILERAPKSLRKYFLYRPGGRPTRDRAFQFSSLAAADTRPFFVPTLPLAASAADWLYSPNRFVPLISAIAWLLIVSSAFCAGGTLGLLAVSALALATAWPAWFLRGFYAEGAGAILVASVIGATALRPMRGVTAGAAAILLGLAVSYHPTLAVLAIPALLILALEHRDIRALPGIAIGFLLGVFPFWAITRWICQPYGDWTHWHSIKAIALAAPEHRAIMLALLVALALGLIGLSFGFSRKIRAVVKKLDRALTPWGWAGAVAAPWLLLALYSGRTGSLLRSAATATWSGIGWPALLLYLAAAAGIFLRSRPIRERVWLLVLSWSSLIFFLIQGVEVQVGLWSHRRFLPLVLAGIALFAAPLSALFDTMAQRKRAPTIVFALGLAIAGLWNLAHWPSAYSTINERGATAWTERIAQQIGTNRLVVFDYFPHSVPYAATLKHRVLGLGEAVRNDWPDVATWLIGVAQTQEVWIVSSWSATAMEQGMQLVPLFSATGVFPTVKSKSFFPATLDSKTIVNHFAHAMPLKPGDEAFQNKILDGGPIGLRGSWGRTRDDSTWTREGSGIIGPIPEKGASVELEIEAYWDAPTPDWPEQTLLVTPPWGGEPLRLTAVEQMRTLKGQLTRPANDADRAATGIYSFNVAHPYNPAEYGIRGYDSDLGVVIRRINIR